MVVRGSGQMGGPPNADYTFSFQGPFANASDARALLIQVRGSAVTAMALGPGDSRNFVGVPDAGDEPLTIVDAGAITHLKLENLPGVVVYVADASNGDTIVITAPMDAWGYSGFRLFYGRPSQMIERPIAAYGQSFSGAADISFSVGATMFTMHFTIAYGPDAGRLGSPGPATLDTGGSAALPVILRLPTPNSLSGFSFTCLTP